MGSGVHRAHRGSSNYFHESSTFRTGRDEVVLQWQDDAMCAQVGTEMFFPEKGGSTREAKKICAACPVVAECLAYAIEIEVGPGIWGGLSQRERNKLRPKDEQRAAAARIAAQKRHARADAA